jgi:phage terminase Nu1 subunit (DNA packaging protein)
MDDEIFLTSKQFVIAFKVSRETLRKWREKGMPCVDKNKYSLSGCLQWVRENIWAPKDDKGDINQEKLLRERAKRKLDELIEKEKRGELVAREQTILWGAMAISNARLAFQAFPRRMSGPLALLSDPKEIELKLYKAIKEILEELAKQLKKKRWERYGK